MVPFLLTAIICVHDNIHYPVAFLGTGDRLNQDFDNAQSNKHNMIPFFQDLLRLEFLIPVHFTSLAIHIPVFLITDLSDFNFTKKCWRIK